MSSAHGLPSAASRGSPVRLIHDSWTYVTCWLTPDIQIMTGAVLAMRRKRSSLFHIARSSVSTLRIVTEPDDDANRRSVPLQRRDVVHDGEERAVLPNEHVGL